MIAVIIQLAVVVGIVVLVLWMLLTGSSMR